MTQVNNLLNTKLNNTTGSVSTSIKNSSGDDVAVFVIIMLLKMLN
jgi:hypothetical protein